MSRMANEGRCVGRCWHNPDPSDTTNARFRVAWNVVNRTYNTVRRTVISGGQAVGSGDASTSGVLRTSRLSLVGGMANYRSGQDHTAERQSCRDLDARLAELHTRWLVGAGHFAGVRHSRTSGDVCRHIRDRPDRVAVHTSDAHQYPFHRTAYRAPYSQSMGLFLRAAHSVLRPRQAQERQPSRRRDGCPIIWVIIPECRRHVSGTTVENHERGAIPGAASGHQGSSHLAQRVRVHSVRRADASGGRIWQKS